MHQLTQQLKSGHMEIVEVPMPQLQPGYILIRNHFSVISSGTEGKTVSDARKGYIAKARSRQKEVKMVIDLIKSQGLKSTYDMVMNKLEALSPLGYSCAGEVLAISEGVTGFEIGDLIACGGNTASHADIVSVPKNLCVKIDSKVDLREAAFTTVSSIALQGIRQAVVQVGSTSVVIGLGLIGIITMKLLEASGIKALGIDINEKAVSQSQQMGFTAYHRSLPGLEELISEQTNNQGADSVIITAATLSLDPVNFAGELCRKKGKVVIVGAVPTGFDRKNYYRKEIDLRMSCSYGPGRYDPEYEEKGKDYPVGYVRWTEQRNMQTIANLLAHQKISFKDLITHEFPLDGAPEAYNLILEKKEPNLGILIKYDTERAGINTIEVTPQHKASPGQPVASLIGAGSFAQNILLPAVKPHFQFRGITTRSGNTAVSIARKYKIEKAFGDTSELLSDEKSNAVFILTRHNLHANYVIESLKAGKHVFVEKPLAMNQEELERVADEYLKAAENGAKLMVGFNRRFSPLISQMLNYFNPVSPRSITIRVNAGQLPSDHWVHDPEIGGGRMVGEGCHFIDLAIFLAGSQVKSIAASALNSSQQDTATIQLAFVNGSIATISYFSNGSKKLPKERIEVFSAGTTALVDDFNRLEVYNKQKKVIKAKKQDKGHTEEIRQWAESITQGKPAPITFEEIYHSHQITYLVLQAIRENRIIQIT